MSRCGYDGVTASRHQAGELAGTEREEYLRHLEDCAECRTLIQRQQRLDVLLPRLPVYRMPDRVAVRAQRLRRARAVLAAAVIAAVGVALLLQRWPDDDRGLVAAALAADAATLAGVRAASGDRAGGPEAADPLPPWLGFVTCSERIAPEVQGVYICALDADGPLGRAGGRAGDVLVRVAGEPVRDNADMYRILARRSPGEEVTVVLRRREADLRARIRVAERVGDRISPFDLEWSPALIASLDRPRPPDEDIDRIFVSLPGRANMETGGTEGGQPGERHGGVRVELAPSREEADRTILAALPYLFGRDGLRVGDTIVAVSDRPVTDRRDLFLALEEFQDTSFIVSVRRRGTALELLFDGSSFGQGASAVGPH